MSAGSAFHGFRLWGPARQVRATGLRRISSGAIAVRVTQRIDFRIPIPKARSRGSISPAGEIAVAVAARPRCASSSVIQPPSELPAMWAVPKPAASISRSTASVRASIVESVPGGSGAERPWPGRSTARTSNVSSSRGSIGLKPRHVWPIPWINTSGSPEPPRWWSRCESGTAASLLVRRPLSGHCYHHAPHAQHQPARTQGPPQAQEEGRDARPEVRPGPQAADRGAPAARGMHARVHDNAQEAQLGASQGRPRAPHERDGGHLLHPRRGAQPPGALGGAGPRRPRQGPAGRALQGRPRDARRRRRERPQEGPLAVRREGPLRMPRRAAAGIRPIEPDSMYGSKLVQQIINKVMVDGKKSIAESIVYDALDILSRRTSQDPVPALEESIKQLTPVLEVR